MTENEFKHNFEYEKEAKKEHKTKIGVARKSKSDDKWMHQPHALEWMLESKLNLKIPPLNAGPNRQ